MSVDDKQVLNLTAGERSARDEADNAKARAWSRLARQLAEAGVVRDESDAIGRKLDEQHRRIASR